MIKREKDFVEHTHYDDNSRRNFYPYGSIEYRWQEAQQSYKWDTTYDHGYCSKALQPDHLQFLVTNDRIISDNTYSRGAIFAIEEVEWCIWHCRGRFARRNSILAAPDGKSIQSLNSMIFEHETDARAFRAYIIAKTNPWAPSKVNLVETEVGYLYSIHLSMSNFKYINGQFVSTDNVEDLDRVETIRRWCMDNCQYRYEVSVNNYSRFVWFENQEDAIYFKFALDLVTNEQEQ